jgi:polysaccharide export outer membrane protein
MLLRLQFFSKSILSVVCFLLIQEMLLIQPGVSKNVTSLISVKQNKQLSTPLKPQPIPTFGDSQSIPQGESSPIFQEDNSELFNTYRLDFGDALNVTVEKFPEFNFAGVVDATGNIFIPLLGRISVKGLTLEEVETKISYELGRRFLQQEPLVLVFLATPRPVTITVIGEIFKPGYYNLSQGTPISTILALVGGSTKNADLRSIIVKRTLVDGSVFEEKLDLYTPLVKGEKEPKINLQAGDTVIFSRLDVGDDRDYDRVLVSRSTLPRQTITVRVVSPIQPAGVALRNIVLPNGSTFLDAIAQLPEFVPLITKEDITLMRFDEELGKVVTQSLNVAETVQTGDITQNVSLRDDDVIIVSRTLLGQIIAGIRVLTQPIRDIFGFTDFIRQINDNFD